MRIGLAPGMSALDVGSGPGAVMRLMADRVGPAGQRHRHRDRCQARRPGARRSPGRRRRQVRADRRQCARARDGAGRAVRPRLLPALPHAYAGSRRGAREDAIVDQAGRRDRGAGVRFRLDRHRAALPRHGRVQSPVRERVQGPWPEPQSRAPAADAVRGGGHRPSRRHAAPRRSSCRSRTWRRC